mmetsp:Transcript_8548/g.20511  ORF Transcript_8548/g.20511 Transcript_8548/m.20511 type:complete len:346 (-) Transcript_8548:3276-4313(-)
MHTVRSPGLKGYIRFQPIGPNLRRSHTTEWKKHSAKMIDLSSPCFEQVSHTDSEKELYARSMLAFSPDGGSLVSLMELCSTCTGTTFCGSDDRKTRKRGCAPSQSASSFFSSLGSQLATSSMFCSITHPPVACISSSAFSATGSCPWPSDTATNRSSVMSKRFPSSRTDFCGTLTPGESRKKMGVSGDESSNAAARSKGTASTNLGPRTSLTHSETARVIRSGRIARMTSSRSKGDSRFHSAGSGSFSGCVCSHQSRHRFGAPSMSTRRFWKASKEPSAQMLCHELSESHCERGFSDWIRGARTSMSTSSCCSSPASIRMRQPSCSEKMRRWRSKRPRMTYAKHV